MNYYTDLIDELEYIYKIEGDVMIRAYYKTSNGNKKYFDFQKYDSINYCIGSYDLISVQELGYYLKATKY